MEEKKAYSTSPELMHYGVKGMKWKDHAYRRLVNGQYVYDQNWRPSDRPGTVTPPVIKRRPQARQVHRENPAVSKANTLARAVEYGAYLRDSPDKIYINHPKYGAKTTKTDYEDNVLGKKGYTKYVKRSNDLKGNTREDITYVKNGKKRLVTKTIKETGPNSQARKINDTNGSHTVISTRVEPGKYDSYKDALKGGSPKAYKAATSSVKEAYRVTSNKVSAGAKEMKAVGAGIKAAAKSVASDSKTLKTAAKNSAKNIKDDAKWAAGVINSADTLKGKVENAKGIYEENYNRERAGHAIREYNKRREKGYKTTRVDAGRSVDGTLHRTRTMTKADGSMMVVENTPDRLFSQSVSYKRGKYPDYTYRQRGAAELSGARAIKKARKAYNDSKKKNGR